uniref:Putative lipocalin-3 1 n=1 Tax=Amblyomma cajennense TaxID=34607 RepID=A0A023FRV3_AMBCJ
MLCLRGRNMRIKTFLFVLGVSHCVNALNLTDLLMALNTTQPIWLKKSTCDHFPHEPKSICVYSLKEYLNETDYSFDQTYYYGPTRNSSHFYGKFFDLGESTDPVMTVSLEQGAEGINYTLRYINTTEHCGVLTYEDGDRVECGLHAWNDSVRNELHGCENAFKEFCNGTAYDLFFDNCTASSENIMEHL